MPAKGRVVEFLSKLLRINMERIQNINNEIDQSASFPDALTEKPAIDDVFLVMELKDPEPIVGDLFRRRFHTEYFPDEPKHFVAFAILDDDSLLSLGYVHYTLWEGCTLCGGLVVDDRHYRRLPASLRQSIKKSGGIAELLLKRSFEMLPDGTIAIWGHVGDMQSEKVCLRVGFEKTNKEFLLVVWRNVNLSTEEKNRWIERVYAITPF